ncbi:MAG: hypothetical protein CR984_07755 [Proteobacteria bacterium]|nr:MAG: hypothetical protein CR984_07755 [Pseudomonadota bacterium]PIE67268.1 MAG: hypothetical protein CSA23_04730 [Deltaproteobacteria bacterium]
MTDGTFEKVQKSDNPMYGPRKLLLCGFPAKAQTTFNKVLDMAGLTGVAHVWANGDHVHLHLSELLAMPNGVGDGTDSSLPRAIIVSGITENQLHTLMTICRKSGMQQALWAALTPTSETWPLEDLLNELQAERKALAKRKKQ